MSRVTMADLTAGTRIRHIRWGSTGRVRIVEGIVSVKWDGGFVEDEISDEGVVFPGDVEITGEGP